MSTQLTPTMTRPNLMRPDCGIAILSEWTVGTPERQRATIDAFAAAWAGVPWPEGLLSCNLLKSNDGRTIANYAQWTSEEAYQASVHTHLRPRAEQIDRVVPGIERTGPAFYKLHRSRVNDTEVVPGCIVLVSIEFKSPDAERQKQWISAVFRAISAMPKPPAGAIGGHFHVGTDGLHVLNYAEWTDEEAHRRALEEPGPSQIGAGPEWQIVRNFPGLKGSRFQRYSIGLSLVSPS